MVSYDLDIFFKGVWDLCKKNGWVLWSGVWMCWALPEVGKMHFCFIFKIFAFQSIHGSHFWFHFLFHFLIIFLPNNENDPKMKLKMGWKWVKNGYCEQPYWVYVMKNEQNTFFFTQLRPQMKLLSTIVHTEMHLIIALIPWKWNFGPLL